MPQEFVRKPEPLGNVGKNYSQGASTKAKAPEK